MDRAVVNRPGIPVVPFPSPRSREGKLGHLDAQGYAERRRAEGKSDREIVRCLKRHVTREVYRHLVRPEPVPVGADLRARRQGAGLSLRTVADAIGSWANRISELERGLNHDTDLARRYARWLDARAMREGGEIPLQAA